jgi:hypothetical protein
MYTTLLVIHSWLRWAVLVLAIALAVLSLAKLKKGEWGRTADRLSLFAVISGDLQLFLGILLYFFGTDYAVYLPHPSSVMSSPVLRYWTIEHAFGMLIAIVFLHLGRATAKRAATPRAKFRRTLLWFGLAAIVMLLTIPWPLSALPYHRPLVRMSAQSSGLRLNLNA